MGGFESSGTPATLPDDGTGAQAAEGPRSAAAAPLPFARWPTGTASCRGRSTSTARAGRGPSTRRSRPCPGLVVTQRGTPFTGRVIEARGDRMTIRDERTGREHLCRLTPGGFVVDGRPVTPGPAGRQAGRPDTPADAHRIGLGRARPAAPPASPGPAASSSRASTTPSSSSGCGATTCGSRASWSSGSTAPTTCPRSSGRSGPAPGRRLGVLLDHLVLGSKEQRLAATLDHPDVLVTGHPFVDVWQAVQAGGGRHRPLARGAARPAVEGRRARRARDRAPRRPGSGSTCSVR